ncbi:hypothetical protein A2757_00275 [Candidatus Giovannonibacteria bacterium RIFCSPHIGHO2_01_FULL_48_47]|nr:MAG: hypothetical protein A2757_00275 [Candidatus Giovannonibacteria bacterium RIFCSPHIGHO2_01_FULL_48_47]OGF68926.1 MAG: hypothetical protein A3D61_03270 [Candidatus Giovannonibacteria bacterium RIFCSPHIGHO2_02_FULL_48_15]OGF90113.1 MAG: hypothetical protein A3B26_01440 [Candidatus Giovannonibacteria bacterium RIFCSPLOWO2_01_FULL_48_47]OGF95509.1 MAG: hypothetical protein A2433_01780 [Candidatus Giovannonibacteria bacterium RIFOXYC1_FULL_48_8]OGF96441.1 MAG: hypothetical protein A2613_02690
MTRLPFLSGKEIIKALEQIGYRKARQRGSHIRLQCPSRKSVTVPDYKMVGRGLLRKILRDAELTPDEFTKLL